MSWRYGTGAILILALLLIAGSNLDQSSEDNPPREEPADSIPARFDEHITIENTLRNMNFCGEIFTAKQIFIDGVDVLQRIAELATTQQASETARPPAPPALCLNIIHNMPSTSVLGTLASRELPVSNVVTYTNHRGHKAYVLTVVNSGFQVDSVTGEIFYMSPIGDIPTPIGNLK